MLCCGTSRGLCLLFLVLACTSVASVLPGGAGVWKRPASRPGPGHRVAVVNKDLAETAGGMAYPALAVSDTSSDDLPSDDAAALDKILGWSTEEESGGDEAGGSDDDLGFTSADFNPDTYLTGPAEAPTQQSSDGLDFRTDLDASSSAAPKPKAKPPAAKPPAKMTNKKQKKKEKKKKKKKNKPAVAKAGPPPSSPRPVDTSQERCATLQQIMVKIHSGMHQGVLAEKFFDMSAEVGLYFQGAAAVYYNDFLKPKSKWPDWRFSNSQTLTFVNGDPHLDNFGTFEDQRQSVVYNLIDFDEAWIADYSLDLWRLATSIALHAGENGLPPLLQRKVVALFARAYARTLQAYVGNYRELNMTVSSHNALGPLKELLMEVKSGLSRKALLDKWCYRSENPHEPRRFRMRRKLTAASEDEHKLIRQVLPSYGMTLKGRLNYTVEYFTVKDIARYLHHGISTLGQARYAVLIEGPTKSQDDDIILDVKHQPAPTWSIFANPKEHNGMFQNSAERVVQGTRAFIRNGDPHLGWLMIQNEPFTVRAVPAFGSKIFLEKLKTLKDIGQMATQWGAVLATGHARADDDFNPDWVPHSFEKVASALLMPRLLEFEHVLADVAVSYKEQVLADFQCFRQVFSGQAAEALHRGNGTDDQENPAVYRAYDGDEQQAPAAAGDEPVQEEAVGGQPQEQSTMTPEELRAMEQQGNALGYDQGITEEEEVQPTDENNPGGDEQQVDEFELNG